MSNEIIEQKDSNPVKFSAENLIDGIKTKIRAEIPGMLSEDQWQELIKKEIENFFKPKQRNTNKGGYGSAIYEQAPSEFGEMVEEELKKIAREYITEQVRPLVKTTWDGQKQNISEELQSFVADAAPDMLVKMMQGIAKMSLQTMASQNGITTY